MKVSEIREQIQNGTSVETVTENIKSQGRKYIPILQKSLIANNIASGCIKEESGLMVYDYFIKKLTSEMKLLSEYFNIDFYDEINEVNDNTNEFDNYDFLFENGIAKELLDSIWQDADIIDDIVWEEIKKIEKQNSLEGLVSKGIDKIIDKLPDSKELGKLLKTLPKALEKLDPNKLEWVNQIVKFNNGETV